MSDSLKKFLIDLGIGLVIAVAATLMLGVFEAETVKDTFRLLSDGFFFSASMFLLLGGLTFTTNGGALDGLGFTFKVGIARMKRDYESSRITFGEYCEERRKKAKSPKETLLAGLVLLIIAAVFVAIYSVV